MWGVCGNEVGRDKTQAVEQCGSLLLCMVGLVGVWSCHPSGEKWFYDDHQGVQSARRCVVIMWMAWLRRQLTAACWAGMLACSIQEMHRAYQEVLQDVLAQQRGVVCEGEGRHEHHMRPAVLGYGQHMPCTRQGLLLAGAACLDAGEELGQHGRCLKDRPQLGPECCL